MNAIKSSLVTLLCLALLSMNPYATANKRGRSNFHIAHASGITKLTVEEDIYISEEDIFNTIHKKDKMIIALGSVCLYSSNPNSQSLVTITTDENHKFNNTFALYNRYLGKIPVHLYLSNSDNTPFILSSSTNRAVSGLGDNTANAAGCRKLAKIDVIISYANLKKMKPGRYTLAFTIAGRDHR